MRPLNYSAGIAGERTAVAFEGNAVALQDRLLAGWELVPTSATTCGARRAVTSTFGHG
jgi:hypothetical protein